jgi:hypothetical protein
VVYLKSYSKHCNTTPSNTTKYYAIKAMPY